MTDAPSLGQGGDAPEIQPHGWLIACDERAAVVRRHSANLQALFPERTEPFIGANLRDILGSEAAHGLRNALSRFAGPARPSLLPGWAFPGRQGLFDLAVYASENETIIEIEPAAPSDPRSIFDRARAMIERVAQARGIDKLLQSAARLVSSMLLYERVAILRFEDDGSTRVAGQKGKASPAAGDRGAKISRQTIPQQTLGLYRDGRIRVIADVTAPPSKILSLDDAGPLDLAFAHLRGPSPDERQTMQEEGYVASLALAIVVEGELWGLIECHDRARKNPGMDLRAAAELFGDFLSLRLQVLLQRQEIEKLLERLGPSAPAETPQSLRVMIVGDQEPIALDLEASLRENGAEVACVAATPALALAALDRLAVDAAILDFNLGEETFAGVATELELRGIPFVFAGGDHDDFVVPARFAGRAVARKPYDAPWILTALRDAVAKGPQHERGEIPDS